MYNIECYLKVLLHDCCQQTIAHLHEHRGQTYGKLRISSTYIYLDIYRMSFKNANKCIDLIYDIPDDFIIPNVIMKLYFYNKLYLLYSHSDVNVNDEINKMFDYFTNRNIQWCWHDLNTKRFTIFNNEMARKEFNNKLLKSSLPVYSQKICWGEYNEIYRNCNYGGSCVCTDFKSVQDIFKTKGSYSLIEMIGKYIEGFADGYITETEIIDYITDLKEWNVPFSEESDGNYPLHRIKDMIEHYKIRSILLDNI